MKQWGQRQASIDSRLLGLLGPYHYHAIGTFNTCSRGSTHRFLIDTGGGYNLRGAGFSHITPRPFQPTVSLFHQRAPPGLQFNQVPPLNQSAEFKKPMAATWSSDHSTNYRSLHLCLAITNDLSLVVGVASIDRKVIVMQLGTSSTPIT
jgi:hypothetical protein